MDVRSKLFPLVAFACVAGFYLWTAVSDNLSWHWGREQTDYYNLLVDGFLDGQLSLKADVPAELLKSPNPYDPDVRPAGVGLHDASLYRGRYYIYHGVTPAVVLLLPFRAITGTDLPLGVGVLFFVVLGFAASLRLLFEIRARYFPHISAGFTTFVAIVLGFATCTAVLLRRGSLYDLPIASGYAFAMAGLFCLWRVLVGARGVLPWLAASSVCWGLAIGSRPIYLLAPASLALVVIFLLRQRNGEPAAHPSPARLALTAFGPIAVIGALLAAYNYARFGSVTEFGVRYILSGVYEAKIDHFQARYVPWNVFAYLFSSAEWSRYFPFQHDVPIALPKPHQHFGMDIPFGLLANVPFLWLAAAAPVALKRPAGELPLATELRVFVATIAWTAVSVAGFLLCFYAAMVRYVADFAPALVLLAAIVTLAWADRVKSAPVPRRAFAVAATCIGGATLALMFLFSFRVYDRVRQFNPELYRSVARVANLPVHALESLAPPAFGAVDVELAFDRAIDPKRGYELIATGPPGAQDRVFVFRTDDQQVQFGYEHAGAPMVRTESIRTRPSALHTVRVSMGSLYPPETHPLFTSWSADEKAAILRRVVIAFDGDTILDRYQRTYPATPDSVVIAGGGGDSFPGTLSKIRREEIGAARQRAAAAVARPKDERIRPDATGSLALRVRFPAHAVAGHREPLVVSGETRRGDVLAVEYLGPETLRFVFEHWGRRPYLSTTFRYAVDREYRFVVQHPVYAAEPRRRRRAGEGELVVAIDGREFWRFEPLTYPVEPADIFIGYNPIGGSASGEKFSGEIAPMHRE